jgi:hypothetical protein
MFGGRILGRNIELVPNQLIVQAWDLYGNSIVLVGPIAKADLEK